MNHRWKGLLMAGMAVLVLTGTVIAATTAVGSIHTTATDFNNADTLDSVEVSGSGQSASVVLGDTQPTTIEDFEDGDITVSDPDWSGWTGDTGSFSAQTGTVIGGTYSGALTASGVDREVSMTRASPTQQGVGATVEISADNGASGDRTRLEIMDGGTELGAVVFGDNNNGIFWVGDGGPQTLQSFWSPGAQYTVRIEPDFGTDEATIYIDGTNEGTFNLATSASGLDGFSVVNEQASSGQTRTVYVDNVQELDTVAAPSGTYISQNHTVDDATAGFTDLTLSNANATVTWEGWTGSGWTQVAQTTYSTSGNRTQALSGGYGKWRVNVTYEKTGSNPTAQLDAEGVEFSNAEPSVDNSSADPPEGATIDSANPTFSIDVSDPTFASAQGETVNASLYINGSYRGSDTLTSNGTANVQITTINGGDLQYHWEVEDDYGGTTQSDTFNVTVPAVIRIVEETNTSKTVGSPVEVTARFFRENNQTVIERTTTDGNISLAGLPANQEYTLVVRADGYHDRRVVIESLFDQRTVYLLNKTNTTAVNVVFTLDDNIGKYPPKNTRLVIEKPIKNESSGVITFRTISGDRFGAAGIFEATLQKDQRYRLRVINNEGDERVLGAYRATADAAETLSIGEVVLRGDSEDGTTFAAELDEAKSGRFIRTQYRDPDRETDEVRITVHRRGNGSAVLIDNQSFSGPYGTLTTSFAVPASAPDDVAYEVEYVALNDTRGEIGNGTAYVGDIPEIAQRFGLAPNVLSMLGYATIVLVTGLTAIASAPLAAVVAVLVATLMTFIGAVPIPPALLGIAGGIAVLANAGRLKS